MFFSPTQGEDRPWAAHFSDADRRSEKYFLVGFLLTAAIAIESVMMAVIWFLYHYIQTGSIDPRQMYMPFKTR